MPIPHTVYGSTISSTIPDETRSLLRESFRRELDRYMANMANVYLTKYSTEREDVLIGFRHLTATKKDDEEFK